MEEQSGEKNPFNDLELEQSPSQLKLPADNPPELWSMQTLGNDFYKALISECSASLEPTQSDSQQTHFVDRALGGLFGYLLGDFIGSQQSACNVQ